ncbi:ABC transporter substrate-binding protein [Shinella sp. 838]|jgi:iron complex transport system substrate-binding protein|uniref:ABC transporter substrate-binding protein n=1 Tax=unclassified Shinella TaxID=2643062 RepID=UPI0003C56BBB|nr:MULTISPECIES: ABC transporter substrate-binding protein [unclassified Shinella]EYR82114.1 ABC-type Fe3+-hydroxamate transport system periplasmic component [Shinella sp. DD12]MDG4670324.1 ABC transporter substrate-binding protein [Shinella sp. 838]TAA62552.1 ferrichrome ABC transporter [Shinella sp. JR1-6]
MTQRLSALIAVVLLFLAILPARAEVTYPLTVKDAFDREITIPAQPKAVLLGSGFDLVALSLIHPNPVSILAGWSSDMQGDNPEIYARFKEKFPEIVDVPVIGANGALSFETMLSLKADLAILANWQADTELGKQAIDYLEKMGVPVVVVDFNSNALKNTAGTMRLLGKVLNREEQANAFADFYDARVKRIRDRVAQHPEPGPTVLMDAFPNPEKCCYAYGTGGLGAFIAITGSRNIAESLPAQGGIVSSEFIIAANPDVYIATASPGGTYSSFSVGPGVAAEEARETLARAVKAPILSDLKAVKDGRVHGLWNFFNTVPLNVLAAEAFAHWLRPDIFADIDPDATLKEINERFAAVPFDGAYWISLKAK